MGQCGAALVTARRPRCYRRSGPAQILARGASVRLNRHVSFNRIHMFVDLVGGMVYLPQPEK